MFESQPQCRPSPEIPLKRLIGRHNAENQPGQIAEVMCVQLPEPLASLLSKTAL